MRLIWFLSGVRGAVKTGLAFSGVVASEGRTFREGEEVMGWVHLYAGERPHADDGALPEPYLQRVPAKATMEEAATLPMSGLTALRALRDVVRVQEGQAVAVFGASGGVGVLTVQIAQALGARVTAVASAARHARLAELGADATVDYRQTPPDALTGSFHGVLDFSNTLRLRDVRHLLHPKGLFVPADPMANALDILLSRQAGYLMVDRGHSEDLAQLAAWVDDGRLTPVVDRVYALDTWREAVGRSHERGRMRRTVLSFADP